MTSTAERPGMPRGGRKSAAEVEAKAGANGDRVTIIFRTEDSVRLRRLAEERDLPLSIMLRHWIRARLEQEAPERDQ